MAMIQETKVGEKPEGGGVYDIYDHLKLIYVYMWGPP